jgi:hypothetical protein
MKTDDLVRMLATGEVAVESGRIVQRYGFAVAAGTACAVALMATALGPRHDLAQAVLLPMFWVKLTFVASMAALGVIGAYRVSRPAARIAGVSWALAATLAAMWLLAAVALVRSDPQGRTALVLGNTWTSCPWLIAALSIPVFVAVAAAMKGMAPTRPRRAGAVAGFAAGAVAALVYSIHCPELGAPFLGTWYLGGILIPTAVGSLLGERLFRW